MPMTKEGPTKAGHKEGLTYFLADKLSKKGVHDILSESYIGICEEHGELYKT